MVITKLLFNNIKEFTPKCIKTIPANLTVQPYFNRQPSRAWPMTRTPWVKNAFRMFHKTFYYYMPMQVLLYFLVAFGLTNALWQPWLSLYRLNNQHRQLDYALKLEREYKLKKEQEEAGDDEEVEEADEE